MKPHQESPLARASGRIELPSTNTQGGCRGFGDVIRSFAWTWDMTCEVSVGLNVKTGFQERASGGEPILSIASTYLSAGRWIRMSLLTKEVRADRQRRGPMTILRTLLGEEVGEKTECNGGDQEGARRGQGLLAKGRK